jgi:predicted exporter
MSVLLEKPTLQEKAVRKVVRAEAGIGTTQTPTHDTRLYSRFLELPVPVVLLTLWVAGVALIGSCALTLYHLLGLLLSASGGP